MLRHSALICFSFLLLNTATAEAQDARATACDTYAASPLDPQRKTAGVAEERLNPALAIPACVSALRSFPRSPRLKYQLGRAYRSAKNFREAISWFQQAAQYGYAPAEAVLGYMSQFGEGIRQNYAAAASWYSRAAARGFAPAQHNLGWLYENGLGVSKDLERAVDFYRRAAEQGHVDAKKRLEQAEIAAKEVAKKREEEAAAVGKEREAREQAERERLAREQDESTKRAEAPQEFKNPIIKDLLDMFRIQPPEYKDPSALLKRAYDDYVTIKACYEIRKGYRYVWINDVQMYEAKQYMGEIEQTLNLPNKDELWEKVDYNEKRNFLIMSMNTNGLGSDGERVLCQNSFNELQTLYEKVLSPKLRKDF